MVQFARMTPKRTKGKSTPKVVIDSAYEVIRMIAWGQQITEPEATTILSSLDPKLYAALHTMSQRWKMECVLSANKYFHEIVGSRMAIDLLMSKVQGRADRSQE